MLLYFHICELNKKMLIPQPPISSTRELLNGMRQPIEKCVATVDNVRFEAIQPCWGPFERLFAFFTLRSGPPCYVLVDGSKLVDWTTDIDSDEAFAKRWKSVAWRPPLFPLNETVKTLGK